MSQNRVFSRKDIIDASRDFVCVRIDTFESEEAQHIVRGFLDGKLMNTAFCILSPDGSERLTNSHRAPGVVLGKGQEAQKMKEIASGFEQKGDEGDALVPDFPNFRLGLNVASAEQRLLVLVVGTESETEANRQRLQSLANDPDVIGRFHYDFETDASTWKKSLKVSGSEKGIMIIEPGTFGQTGKILSSLSFDADLNAVKKAMLKANRTFAKEGKKKNYSAHARAGKAAGISWEMPMEFGEDRDGDGKIDHRPRH